jgi:hypothetical protein
VAIKHTFVSAKSDGADDSLVRPSNWNADHEIGALPMPAVSEPSSPTADTVVAFVRASGVSPNRLTEYCAKFSDGTVFVIASKVV